MELCIALLQIEAGKTVEETQRRGIDACRVAKAQGADIALFPEMFNQGYRIYDRPTADWTGEAVDADGAFVNAFGEVARELDMAIAITFLERYGVAPRNTMVLFDRFGQRKLTYAKVHTCDFSVEKHLTPGNDFSVATLNTAKGDVAVGAMICYDREFPESARVLMLQGAELIVVPNACPMEINRLSQLRARAFENMVAIATCNYPDTVPDCNGGSSVFDGIAYLPDRDGDHEMCLLQAGSREGVYLAKVDLDLLRRYRECEVHGNAFRRPTLYGALTAQTVAPPFVRPEARR